MSSEIAIRVSNLGKCYEIYDSPRDRLKQFLYPKIRRAAGWEPRNHFREFWALRDVSFEVGKGQTIGIIGRNGSGKSTLLQLICGTLTPTCGTIETNGRIAALLELGAGFNPEFTGRENVYMNAALLGLSRDEVEARFAAIAAFADIGQFMEQPIKTYSSGMFVRLAFAVAVHSSPDILVVDEALSVGDIAFRNKCLEEIQRLVKRGVTILFVTHDISTLQLLCSRVIWLDHGMIKASGEAIRVSQDYYVQSLEHSAQFIDSPLENMPVQQETGKALFTEIRLVGDEEGEFTTGQPLEISFSLLAKEDLGPVVFAVSVYRADGDWLLGQTSRDAGIVWKPARAGETRHGSLFLDPLCLTPGDYLIAFGANSEDHSICYALTDLCLRFSVRSPHPTWGKFLHPCRWLPEETRR